VVLGNLLLNNWPAGTPRGLTQSDGMQPSAHIMAVRGIGAERRNSSVVCRPLVAYKREVVRGSTVCKNFVCMDPISAKTNLRI